MNGFYGHLLARAALERDDLWPYPILDLVAEVGIVVNAKGRRLVDESWSGVTTTNAVAWSGDPLGCWIVVDDAGWETEGRVGVTRPNPYIEEHGGTVLSAPTMDELAITKTGRNWVALAFLSMRQNSAPPSSGAAESIKTRSILWSDMA